MSTMYPGLSTPAYFDFHGYPAVITGPRSMPKVLRPSHPDKWEMYEDLPNFNYEADRITREKFDKLVGEIPNAAPAPEPAEVFAND